MKFKRLQLICAGILFGIWFSVTAFAEPIVLTFATQEPDTSWGYIHALKPWTEMIEQAAQDRVKIKIYPSQTLCEGTETWDTVRRGIADMGWCFHGYWADMTPLANVITLPALPFRTAEKGSEILWHLYEKYPEIRNEFKDNHILLLYTSNPYILITSHNQVKNLNDISGMKIRIPGGPPTEQIKALGGIPVLFPMPKNYELLKNGVIDGMGAPWEAIYGYKLYEVVKYYTEAPLPAVYFSIAINKSKWNSLPSDIQEIFMKVSGIEGARFWGRNFFDMAKNAVYTKTKESGIEINYYVLPEDERNKWLEIAGKPVWEKWISKMKQQGYPVASDILKSVLEWKH